MVSTRSSTAPPRAAVNDYPPERQRKTDARSGSAKDTPEPHDNWPADKQPETDQEKYDYRMWFYKTTPDLNRRRDKLGDRQLQALQLAWYDRRTRHARSVANKYADVHLKDEAFDFEAYDSLCNDWKNKSLESGRQPVWEDYGAFDKIRPARGYIVEASNQAGDYGDDEFDSESSDEDDFELWIDADSDGIRPAALRDAYDRDGPPSTQPGCLDDDFTDRKPDPGDAESMRIPWQQKRQPIKKVRPAQLDIQETEFEDRAIAPDKSTSRSSKRKATVIASNEAESRALSAKKSKPTETRPSTGRPMPRGIAPSSINLPDMIYDENQRIGESRGSRKEEYGPRNGTGTNHDHGDHEFEMRGEPNESQWERLKDDGRARSKK